MRRCPLYFGIGGHHLSHAGTITSPIITCCGMDHQNHLCSTLRATTQLFAGRFPQTSKFTKMNVSASPDSAPHTRVFLPTMRIPQCIVNTSRSRKSHSAPPVLSALLSIAQQMPSIEQTLRNYVLR